MYYLQSRYYDPELGRFLNADSQFDSNAGHLGYNLYSYCANSPVGLKDSSGSAFETALDVVSALINLIKFIGKPSWTAAGELVWDIGSIFIPFVPGSYVGDGIKLTFKVAGKIDDFMDNSKLLKGSYKQLKQLVKGLKGIEIHHLIEKRFAALFSCKPNDFFSIALTPEMHRIITNRWRNLHKLDDAYEYFAYGSNYSLITYEQMVSAVKEVYYDMPEILNEVLDWLSKNWG
jgi:hypothetical protein